MWTLITLAVVFCAALITVAAFLWGRRNQKKVAGGLNTSGPYDDAFDRKSVYTVLDWYVLRHLEDEVRVPVEQRFLDADRANNDFLNRYYCHLLAKEGALAEPMPSTLESFKRDPKSTEYTPCYFPDQLRDENLVTFKHERIARRLVKTVEYLQRLRDEAAEPFESLEKLKPGFWPFVPDGYTAFYNNLVATGQNMDQDPAIREQMRKLAAHLVFPRFKEHIDFWADKGLTLYQLPEILARDVLTGWFYLDVPPRPMPTPEFLLKGET